MLTRLLQTIQASVPGVVDVSVGRRGQPGTAKVLPPQYQAAAQATIDAFDWSEAAQQTWEEDQHPERKSLRQAALQAVADIDTYLAIADSATALQVRTQTKRHAQILRAVIRRLIQID